jgi:hypothetical protein
MVAVLAAMALICLICTGGICGAVCDTVERAANGIDRFGRWLKEPIK